MKRNLILLLVASLAIFAAVQDVTADEKASGVSSDMGGMASGIPFTQPLGHGPVIVGSAQHSGSEIEQLPPFENKQSGLAPLPPVVEPGKQDLPTLLDLLRELQLTRLVDILSAESSVLPILDGPGFYTIFAPNDLAFNSLGERNINILRNDPIRLRQFLLYHVLVGKVMSSELTDGQRINTLSGEQIVVHRTADNLMINTAQVLVNDKKGRNVVVHVIDMPLIPPSFGSFGSFGSGVGSGTPSLVLIPQLLQDLSLTRLSSLLPAELLTTLGQRGPYTLFAPSDAALNRISQQTLNALAADPIRLRSILLYHVVPGLYPSNVLTNDLSLTTLEGGLLKITTTPSRQIRVNDALVTSPDHFADNGVIHIIDSILLPSSGNPLPTITELAQQLGLTTFLENVRLADQGMWQTLNSPGPYTVFIPTNEAWTRLATERGSSVASYLSDPLLLRQIMFYHILFGSYPSSVLTEGRVMTLDDNQRALLSRSEAAWRINTALVTDADHTASNGVIHLIDTVLLPPNLFPGLVPGLEEGSAEALIPSAGSEALSLLDLASRLRLTRFLSLLGTAADPTITQLLQGSSQHTLFIPNDIALAQLNSSIASNPARLRELILYWISPGLRRSAGLLNGRTFPTLEGERLTSTVVNNTRLTINGVRVISTDNIATNGVIHVLEGIIYPPSFSGGSSAMTAALIPSEELGGSSVSVPIPTLAQQLSLSKFSLLLQQSGLQDVLNGNGIYTVFAPSDAAFKAIPTDTLNALLASPDLLRQVLSYHVLPGLYTSSALSDGLKVITLQGSKVIVTRPANVDSPLVNDAHITTMDQLASNGVIHVIDRVLIPASLASGITHA